MRIAIIGTDGLPARYGGFETCVEQLAPRLAGLGHTVDVLGSSVGRTVRAPDHDRLRHHYLPLRANGAASVPYDLIGFLQSVWRSDAVVLLGVSAGVFMPLMRAIAGQRPVIVNVDGLESRRGKWQGFQRRFLGWSEALAVRHASHVVSDNQGIADADEQIKWLDRVAGAEKDLITAESKAAEARLKLVSQCRDEASDPVNAYLTELSQLPTAGKP